MPDKSNLVTKAALITITTEVEIELPDITILDTKAAHNTKII